MVSTFHDILFFSEEVGPPKRSIQPLCQILDHLVTHHPGLEEAEPTFHFGHKAEALLEVRADAVEAPAELGVAAVLVGAAGVVARVQLVAALGHGGDLYRNKGQQHARWSVQLDVCYVSNVEIS